MIVNYSLAHLAFMPPFLAQANYRSGTYMFGWWHLELCTDEFTVAVWHIKWKSFADVNKAMCEAVQVINKSFPNK